MSKLKAMHVYIKPDHDNYYGPPNLEISVKLEDGVHYVSKHVIDKEFFESDFEYYWKIIGAQIRQAMKEATHEKRVRLTHKQNTS